MSNPTIPVQRSGDKDKKADDATVVTMATNRKGPSSEAPAEKETKPVVKGSSSEASAEEETKPDVDDLGPAKLVFSIQLNCGGCQKGVEKKLEAKKAEVNDAFEYKVVLDKENGSTVSFWGDIEKDEAEEVLTETKKEFKFIEPKKKCCGGGCCSKKQSA